MHQAYKNDIKAMPEWASAKLIHETRGITAPQLRRYAREGLIRTSNILRPGHARGKRLFSVIDLDNLIERSIESRGQDMAEAVNVNPNPTSER